MLVDGATRTGRAGRSQTFLSSSPNTSCMLCKSSTRLPNVFFASPKTTVPTMASVPTMQWFQHDTSKCRHPVVTCWAYPAPPQSLQLVSSIYVILTMMGMMTYVRLKDVMLREVSDLTKCNYNSNSLFTMC